MSYSLDKANGRIVLEYIRCHHVSQLGQYNYVLTVTEYQRVLSSDEYCADTWTTTKIQERRLEVNEIRMLMWMCGVTKKNKTRNENVSGSMKVNRCQR